MRDFLLLARPVPENRESVNVDEVAEEVVENIKLSNEWKEGIKLNQNIFQVKTQPLPIKNKSGKLFKI